MRKWQFFSLGAVKILSNLVLFLRCGTPICVIRILFCIFFRFKPFFPFQVSPPDEYEDRDLCIQDFLLIEGRLQVTLIECTRYLLLSFAHSLLSKYTHVP